MKDDTFHDFYDHQSEEKYEASHAPRLDFIVEDFKLNELDNKRIADFGCGYGCLFKRLQKKNNTFIGFDGYEQDDASRYCEYHVTDLDSKFADKFLENNKQVDIATCLETMEHVLNPYNALYEMKKILKEDGLLYLSIPHSAITHNTIYPTLIYPPNNFMVFLKQMAFKIEDARIHNKAFAQVVFTLRNKDWSHCEMVWKKDEEKFENIPPHIAVNL